MIDPAGVSLDAGAFRLRPANRDDRDGIVRAGQSPGIGGRLPWFPAPFPDHYADGWIARAQSTWASGEHLVFSILDGGEVYVGSVVLSVQPPGDVLDVAYWVLPDRAGQGAATAAAGAVMDWARRTLRPKEFRARARLDNHASLRILRKLGFAQTGEADGQRMFAINESAAA